MKLNKFSALYQLGFRLLTVLIILLVGQVLFAAGIYTKTNYYSLTKWSPIYQQVTFSGMMCNEQVQLSLDASGKVKVTAAMLLAPPVGPPASYVVNIVGKITDTITCVYVNQKVKVQVRDIGSGNICWSFVLVEDKLAPTVTCRDTTVLCTGMLNDIDSIPGLVTIQDNCNAFSSLKISHIDKVKLMDCANDTFSMVTRTWTAIDLWGRVGSCTQKISLLRADRADIVFPKDTTIYCPQTNVSPSLLGQPSIGGKPLDKFCGWIVSFEDQSFNKCGITKKILRTWSIFDCCALSDTTVTQFILIADTTPPVITCKLIDSVSTSPELCVANYKIPQVPSALDACHTSGLTTLVTVDSVTLTVPGATIPLTIGMHTLQYEVSDPCGNRSYCTTKLLVKDKQKPALICMDSIQISLPTDLVHIKPENFSGIEAFDNCGILEIKFRRTVDYCADGIDDTKFNDSITVCCADINQIFNIVFLVTDIYGNKDSCSVRASVVDKSAPTLNCAQDDTLNCLMDVIAFNWIDPLIALTDNCNDSVKVTIDTLINTINICNLGTISRRIIAIDPGNNRDTCVQSITVIAGDTLTPDEIELPIEGDTIKVIGCSPGLILEDSIGYVPPIVTFNALACNKIFIRFSDSARSTAGTSRCAITKRTWIVGDSCLSYGPIKTLIQIIIQDTVAFSPLSGPILGKVINLQSMPIEDVHIAGRNSYQQWIYSEMTDQEGKFLTRNNQAISAIKLDKEEDEALNGISTLDLLKIQLHIAGIHRFESPMEAYAADVDKNGNINVLDLIALRKIILGINQNPNDLPWIFTKYPTTTTSIQPGIAMPSEYVIADQVPSNLQFVGIRTGDVNHDAITSSGALLESRNQKMTEMNLMESDGTMILMARQAIQLNGFQISFQSDLDWSAVKITSDFLHGLEYATSGKEIRISWTNLNTVLIPSNMPIITIRGAHPKIKAGSLAGQWYSHDYEIHPVHLNTSISTSTTLDWKVYPNPVEDQIRVEWNSPIRGSIHWRILSQTGQLVQNGNGLTGESRYQIDARNLPEGLYILEVQMPDGDLGRKKLFKIK